MTLSAHSWATLDATMTVFSSARRKTNLPLSQKVQQSDDVAAGSRSTRSAGGATDFSSAATDVFSTRNASAAVPDRVGVSTASYAAASPCGDAAITEVWITSDTLPHCHTCSLTSALLDSGSSAHSAGSKCRALRPSKMVGSCASRAAPPLGRPAAATLRRSPSGLDRRAVLVISSAYRGSAPEGAVCHVCERLLIRELGWPLCRSCCKPPTSVSHDITR